MDLVFLLLLDTLGIAKAFGNKGGGTSFAEYFNLVSRSLHMSAALLIGGNTVHVVKKTGQGIHSNLGVNSGRATTRGKNNQPFTNKDYDAEPAVGLSNVNVQQHKGHDVEADGTPQFHDGHHNLREEGSGQIKIKLGHNSIETTLLPDPPTADELCAVQQCEMLEQTEVP